MDLLQHSSLKVNDIYYTAKYISHTANYFDIMNSVSLDPHYMQKLMKFLVFITKWKKEIDDDIRECCVNKFNFITKQTCKDFTRSVKGFIHIVQYVQENIPTLNIVPRTISQDDVENYFSLQRSRKAGGDITVADFFAGNKALSTHMMLNANEKTDKELGNYSRVAVTPHSNIVLHRSNLYKNVHSTKLDDWKPTDVNIKSYVPLYNTQSLLKPGLK